MARSETVDTLIIAREWIAKAAEQVRPLGPGACGQHDAMLARIDAALASEVGASESAGSNQRDQRHPVNCGPKVYL